MAAMPIEQLSFSLVSIGSVNCFFSNFPVTEPKRPALYVYDVDEVSGHIIAIRPQNTAKNFQGCLLTTSQLPVDTIYNEDELIVISNKDFMFENEYDIP